MSNSGATIKDVAEAAGVSVYTANDAFMRPERLGRATVERILAVADELGYIRRDYGTRRGLSVTFHVSNPGSSHLFALALTNYRRAQKKPSKENQAAYDTALLALATAATLQVKVDGLEAEIASKRVSQTILKDEFALLVEAVHLASQPAT